MKHSLPKWCYFCGRSLPDGRRWHYCSRECYRSARDRDLVRYSGLLCRMRHCVYIKSFQRTPSLLEGPVCEVIVLEDLDRIWSRQRGCCAYTGVPLVLPATCNRNPDSVLNHRVASIDRIDPSRGYVRGNIQIVSRMVNHAKHAMSHEEFLAVLEDLMSRLCPCASEIPLPDPQEMVSSK